MFSCISAVGGGGFNANTTVGGQSEPNKEGVLPVVIRQLLLADEGVEMYGRAFAMINTVVIVRKIDFTSTKITYTLEDHTGQIDAHFWLEGDDTSNQPNMTLNCYARIIGSLRNVGDTKAVVIYHAEEILDPNEVTAHMLEVLHSRFKAEAYQKNGVRNVLATSAFGGSQMNAAEPTVKAEGQTQPNPYGLAGQNLAMFVAIRQNGGSIGMGRKELEQKFSHLSKQDIANALDHMVNEGMIYTTVDADHFLTVEA